MDILPAVSVPALDRVVGALREHGCDPRGRSGGQFSARCPAHGDRKKSLEVGLGDDGRVLLTCHAGCSVESVAGALGLSLADLFDQRSAPLPPVETTYQYVDENGTLLHELVRLPGKVFYARRPDGLGGWINNTAGVRRVLYRLPDLLQAVAQGEPVWIAEGEKDADALGRTGCAATTCPNGVGGWRTEFAETFRGADVRIVYDVDAPGEQHARRIAGALRGIAARVRIFAPVAGKDVSDHLAASRSLDDLRLMFDSAAGASEWSISDATDASPSGSGLRRLSDVTPELLEWLWPRRIPLGKVVILEADPGVGKSTITADLAARVSTGSEMPDGPSDLAGPAGVVLINNEDGIADTVLRRVIAAGGDDTRVWAFDGELRLPRDIERLGAFIREAEAALVVIDPLFAYVDGAKDSYNDQHMRSVLTPLAKLAEETGAAIIAIRHFNKTKDVKAISKGGGSVGIAGVARSVLQVHQHPAQSDHYVLCIAKANLAAKAEAYEFMFVDCDGVGRIEWLGAADFDADELLTTHESVSALAEAEAFLRQELAEGPVQAAKAAEHATENGISVDGALKRARGSLGVISKKHDGCWWWLLPGTESFLGASTKENAVADSPLLEAVS